MIIIGLQVWLPLNGNVNNLGLNNSIIPQVMGTGITYTAGKIGQAATFPNSCASCIYMDGLKLQTGSWCAWIKVLGEGAGTSQRIISEGRDTGSIGTNIFVTKAGTTLNLNTHKKQLQTTIELNTWYHVAAIFGNGSIKLYINGSQVGNTTYTDTDDSDYAQSNDKLVLGKMSYSYTNTSNYFPFNGQINDFRIYDHCLSPREVNEISKGLVLHYPLSRGGFGQDNMIVNSSGYEGLSGWTQSSSNTLSVVNDNDYGACLKITSISSHNARININQNITSKFDLSNFGTYTLSFYYKAESTNTSSGVGSFIRIANTSSPYNDKIVSVSRLSLDNKWHFCQTTGDLSEFNNTGVTSITIFLFAYKGVVQYSNVKLEPGSIATPWIPNSADSLYTNLGLNNNIEYDVSGYRYNGTKVGTLTYSSDTPRYNVSSTLINSTDRIQITQQPYSSGQSIDQISISIWFKTDQSNGDGSNLFSLGQNYFIRARIPKNDTSSIWTYLRYSTSAIATSKNIGKTLTDNAWHHFVFVWDNGIQYYYLDGVLANTSDISTTTTQLYYSTESTWMLGGYNATSEYFIGQLSDFRIYTTALSASDILELYHTPETLANNGTLLTQGEFVES